MPLRRDRLSPRFAGPPAADASGAFCMATAAFNFAGARNSSQSSVAGCRAPGVPGGRTAGVGIRGRTALIMERGVSAGQRSVSDLPAALLEVT